MSLTIREAMSEFSYAVMQKVEVLPELDTGFKNFFKENENVTRGVKVFVERQGRPIAKDIALEEKGITTRRDKSTEKFYIPPYFDYKFNYSALEEFEPFMGEDNSTADMGILRELVENTAKGVQENADRMERRRELQRAQSLLTGIVTMDNGDNINFQRKSASLVAYDAAHGWDVDTVSPDIILKQGAEFLIKEGKVSTKRPYNIIAGSAAISALKDNPIFQKYTDNRRYSEGQFETAAPTEGLVSHGRINAGDFRFNLWGYPAYYDDPDTGLDTSYMDTNKIIILPDAQVFSMQFCGVKGWDRDPYQAGAVPKIKKTKMYSYEIKSIESCALELGLRSSFTPILDKVDAVFTAQVVADQQGQG